MESTNNPLASDKRVIRRRPQVAQAPINVPDEAILISTYVPNVSESKINSTIEEKPIQPKRAKPKVAPNVTYNSRVSKISNNYLQNKGAGEIADEDALQLLQNKYISCTKACEETKKELDTLKNIIETKRIDDIGLNYDSKLIDLLVKKILLPKDWKYQIDLLINIPTSIKGTGILKGGDYFEALFQLAFAINIVPQFRDFKLDFFEINKYKTIEPRNGTYLYTQTVLNSGGGQVQGISDICFKVSDGTDSIEDIQLSYKCGQKPVEIQNMNGKCYFFSVKNFIKEKSVKSNYDIPLLQAQTFNLSGVSYENARVCVCIRDKNNFLSRLERTKIDFIKSRLDTIIGYDEIIQYFNNFRINFFNKYPNLTTEEQIYDKIKEIYPENKVIKPSLQLFYHQELVADSVVKSINDKSAKFRSRPHFLTVGVLPRGGKSYIAGGIINRLKENKGYFNVLFLTSAVSETISQFKDDLIERFSDFTEFKFIDIRNYNARKKLVLSSNRYNFIFMSRELASITEKAIDNTITAKESSKLLEQVIKRIQEPHFDLIFFDEAHKGILTETTANNFKSAFTKFNIPIILMTATYKKTLAVLDDSTDLFVWDLFDIQEMTKLPFNNSESNLSNFMNSDIVVRYGSLALNIIKNRISIGQKLSDIVEPYDKFAKPVFISPTFSDDTIRKLHLTQSGYNHSDIFKINYSPILLDDTNWKMWETLLVNREHALILRDYLTPTDEELTHEDTILINDKKIDRNEKALIKIFRKAQQNQTRPSYGTPFTSIMFLPTHLDRVLIGALCRVWGSFMAQTKFWGDNFTILTLSELDETTLLQKVPVPTISEETGSEEVASEETGSEEVASEETGSEEVASEEDNKTYGGKYYELIQYGGDYVNNCVNSGMCLREKIEEKDLKTKIINIERESLKKGKGLLILTGKVAQMGISLPCADVAFLLDSDSESDDIIQKMFRALTDSPGKKFGFIVDVNIKRIVRALFEYDIKKDKLRKGIKPVTAEERITNILELCDWGYDAYSSSEKSGIDYHAFMEKIKNKMFSKLDLLEITSNQIKDEVSTLLSKNNDIFKELIKYIRKDKVVKQEKQQVENKASEDVPEPKKSKPRAKKSAVTNNGENSEQNKIFEDNIRNLVQTFINSLLFREGDKISWNDKLTLQQLLDIFNRDKDTSSDKIECTCTLTECNFSNNIYERIYCDISTYINNDTTINLDEKIRKVINIIYNQILGNKNIQVVIQSYIESFVEKIDKKYSRGGFRITRKKRKY